jgi:hypothetical protein
MKDQAFWGPSTQYNPAGGGLRFNGAALRAGASFGCDGVAGAEYLSLKLSAPINTKSTTVETMSCRFLMLLPPRTTSL